MVWLIALPWLIGGEAVAFVPFIAALVFGMFSLGPMQAMLAAAWTRSPLLGLARSLAAAALIASIWYLLLVPPGPVHIAHLPLWVANHLFFLAIASLTWLKLAGIAVIEGLNRLSRRSA
ncbi:hypothetical protein ACBY01_10935 [Sphingomonas sp. ac-8]|uniref:hypothetical protein n=1 Tax=Sphingomonas sp. ac-8 TaxID=3242977 RepID=UPI003A802B36